MTQVLAKNVLYAFNSVVAGPILAFPLGYVTDYAVDTAATAFNSLTANKALEQSLRP